MAHQPAVATGQTLPGALAEMARSEPRRKFVIDRDETVTYAALDERSRRIAQALHELGVKHGDRVAIWLPNASAWLSCFFACVRLGAIVVALNTRFRSAEIADVVRRSGARVLVFWPRFRGIDFQEILAEVDSDSLAALETIVIYDENEYSHMPDTVAAKRVRNYRDFVASTALDVDFSAPDEGCVTFTTSGTTRAPKFVLHSQSALLRHAHDVASSFKLRVSGSTILVSVPLAGMFGFSQAMAALAAGATMVTSPIFDSKDSIRLIRSHGVTHMVAADIMVDRMLAAANVPDAFASVKFCAYANFTPGLDNLGSRAAERSLTLVGLYGSSEVQALFARQSETAPLEERVEKGGQPVSAEAHVRVRDVATGRLLAHGEQGELEIKAPSLMIGYFGNPKAFAEAITDDGYFRTGDLGHTLPDSRFVYVARLDDSLRLGGFLVNPAEIEGVVQEHPSVKECQIVGVEYGNEWRAFAFVIAKPGQLVKEPEIISHCQRRLSKSKVPLRVHQIEAFPVTESANAVKIQKGRLRELAQRLLS
jgi:fatty-acyl-CoA synthase